MGKVVSLDSKGSGSGPTAALLFHIRATLDIPIRWRIAPFPGALERDPVLLRRAEALCTFPFIRPLQRTLTQLPSSSLPLNGGKGYKVSPQRPIQSTVYSGNLTPAGVSASASDCYRAVREESERLEVRGKPIGPWFSEWIRRTPWGPGERSGGTQYSAKFKFISRP